MRTNLVMRFNCSECGNQLILRLPEESAEPIELPLRCENPPKPVGANKLNAGLIMIKPCAHCIEKYTGPAKKLAEAIKTIQQTSN